MKGFGLYLLILVCLLAGVSYVVSQTQKTESISYSDVYSYFEQGDVDRYTGMRTGRTYTSSAMMPYCHADVQISTKNSAAPMREQ